MNLQLAFAHQTVTLLASRGDTRSERRYLFVLQEANGDVEMKTPTWDLTVGLDVAFLSARQFADNSLLVLYHTGDPVNPQYVVAEFYTDDTSRHLRAHGPDLIAAHADYNTRKPGDLTATPPDIEAAEKAKALDAKLAKDQGLK